MQEEEFYRLESELRLEQESQIREVQNDSKRRLKLCEEETREDVIHTLVNSVQVSKCMDLVYGDRFLILQIFIEPMIRERNLSVVCLQSCHKTWKSGKSMSVGEKPDQNREKRSAAVKNKNHYSSKIGKGNI